MDIENGLLRVAENIMDLKYIEMTKMAELLVSSIKSSAEDGQKFDPLNELEWCELLRWWAEGYIDAAEDEKAA